MNEKVCIGTFAFLICTVVPAAGSANERGAVLYERHCTPCHGAKADGQGPAAYLLSPKPRDFTSGLYKFRSTPSGSLPTDADILRTLKHGVPGTAMPAWDRLPEADLVAIVQHVKSFSKRSFDDEDESEPPIEIGTAPASTAESAAAGAAIYKKMKCAECHGPQGRGDGPASAGLVDEWRRPIRPYDFTRGASSMKGGGTLEDIYRTFMTGLSGTPMPAYADLLSKEQGWQLVHHVQSLFVDGGGPAVPAGTPALSAAEAQKDLPLDPSDAAWKSIPATRVPLRPLWARDRRVESVEVRVAVGPTAIAFRFEWRDPAQDADHARHEDFRDAVAVQFAPGGNPDDHVGLPFIGMGDRKATVHLWHWKADWEADIAAGKLRDVKQRYPGMYVDPLVEQADKTVDPVFLAGLAARNSLSARDRKSPVEALVAKGFGTLTSLPADKQTVEGKGVWQDGAWSVVVRRPRSSDAPPTLSGGTVVAAVAVWDGSAGDRNGQKAVSQWMKLSLGGAPPAVDAPPTAGATPPKAGVEATPPKKKETADTPPEGKGCGGCAGGPEQAPGPAAAFVLGMMMLLWWRGRSRSGPAR